MYNRSERMLSTAPGIPWNKGKLIGQKPPLQPKHIWAIWTNLQRGEKLRNLCLFNVAIDSKMRACESSNSELETSHLKATRWIERLSDNARQAAR